MSECVTKKELREEASKWMKKNKGDYSMRSCWNCNLAHEHLKKVNYVILCFECGKWYFKGVDISI